MTFDTSAYLRVDASQGLGSTASGASFATSSGDLLEVNCYGPGIFRVRLGPQSRPDYGLIVGRTKACEIVQGAGLSVFRSGDGALEVASNPLRIRLLHRERELLASITDLDFRGTTRLPAFGRMRAGGQWIGAFALASGEAVYGLGEKFGPLDKRGQLVHSHVSAAQGVNTGFSAKDTPFAWSPGVGEGAWGVFAHTPASVTHGVGHPPWSHRSYALVVDDEALDLFLMAGDAPADILRCYSDLTGCASAVPLWSLGLWVSRAAFGGIDEAATVATRLRTRRIPCDVIALDAGAVWHHENRFDFAWDAARVPDPVAALAPFKALQLKVSVAESPYVSVHSPLFPELAVRGYLVGTPTGHPYVFHWGGAPEGSPFAELLSPLPQSGMFDFTNPAAYAWWRDAHALLFDAGVDVITCEGGEHVPNEAVAFNGDAGARLHNVYPLLYNRCVFEATAKFQRPEDAPPLAWGRAGWTGSQRVPIQSGSEPQCDWEGLAASLRGALSWGMSGGPYYSSDVGGFYSAEPPAAELYVRWLQMAVFASHIRLQGMGEREPWAFGTEAEAVARKWLAFRYRLLPYLQRTIEASRQSGLPVMRAMPLAFPRHPLTTRYETQFMCGDALLVAPVLKSGGEVEIAFPPGAWFDLNTRQRFAGQRVVRYRAALDQFPVFGREGHALPLGRAVQHTGEIDPERPLERIWVFGELTTAPEGFAQLRLQRSPQGTFSLETDESVRVERFGEAGGEVVNP